MQAEAAGWHAEQWSALGVVVTAIIAVVAAVFAFFQLREARRLREAQARPFVIVDVQTSHAIARVLNLVVENIGRTLARNVRFSFLPPLTTTMKGYDIANTVLVREGIAMLPPGRRMEYLFDESVARHKQQLPSRYEVVVDYDDASGRRQESLRFTIDLSPLYGVRFIRESGMHQAAEALQAMSRTLDGWTGAAGRLSVSAVDEARQEVDEQVEYALTGQWPSLATKRPPEMLVWLLTRFPVLRIVLHSFRESQSNRPRG